MIPVCRVVKCGGTNALDCTMGASGWYGITLGIQHPHLFQCFLNLLRRYHGLRDEQDELASNFERA